MGLESAVAGHGLENDHRGGITATTRVEVKIEEAQREKKPEGVHTWAR
jgi:hypothetical protein